jgi:hypothetical protein
MATVLKRILLSIIGGTLFQLLIYSLFYVCGAAGLSIIFLWAALLFESEPIPQTWARYLVECIIIIGLNNLIYATLIYFLLWNRAVEKEPREIISVEAR